jgi:hypothetical protein
VIGNIKNAVNRRFAQDIRSQQIVFIRVNTGYLLVLLNKVDDRVEMTERGMNYNDHHVVCVAVKKVEVLVNHHVLAV